MDHNHNNRDNNGNNTRWETNQYAMTSKGTIQDTSWSMTMKRKSMFCSNKVCCSKVRDNKVRYNKVRDSKVRTKIHEQLILFRACNSICQNYLV